jgi:hypothetical protein
MAKPLKIVRWDYSFKGVVFHVEVRVFNTYTVQGSDIEFASDHFNYYAKVNNGRRDAEPPTWQLDYEMTDESIRLYVEANFQSWEHLGCL